MRVYKLEECAQAAGQAAQQLLADAFEEELAMLGELVVDIEAERAAADAVSGPLELLVKLKMEPLELHATLKTCTSQAAMDAHADAFKANADEWARMLRTASEDKETISQYIAIACDVYPVLIRKWGRLVVFVCEQVQERFVNANFVFHHQVCSRQTIGEQLRHLSRERTSEVHYQGFCAQPMLTALSAEAWAY